MLFKLHIILYFLVGIYFVIIFIDLIINNIAFLLTSFAPHTADSQQFLYILFAFRLHHDQLVHWLLHHILLLTFDWFHGLAPTGQFPIGFDITIFATYFGSVEIPGLWKFSIAWFLIQWCSITFAYTHADIFTNNMPIFYIVGIF